MCLALGWRNGSHLESYEVRLAMNAWLLAARPKTLLASWTPVAMGTALAYRDGGLHWPAAVACLLGATAIQIGTNYCNDYFDFVQGADTAARKGPTRAVAAGLLSPRSMLRATTLTFVFALAIGGYLSWRAGWPLFLLAVISVACGIWYTAGRYSLAYQGWSEPFVVLFFGPVAVGVTYFVQTLSWSWPAAILGLAPGLISCGLLCVNNLRDIDEDRAAGKQTLAVRLGEVFARWEYTLCLILAGAVPFLVWSRFQYPAGVLWGSLVIALALPVVFQVWRLRDAEINRLLGRTAGILFLFGVAVCLGVTWN